MGFFFVNDIFKGESWIAKFIDFNFFPYVWLTSLIFSHFLSKLKTGKVNDKIPRFPGRMGTLYKEFNVRLTNQMNFINKAGTS